jgi:hypothetical protein
MSSPKPGADAYIEVNFTCADQRFTLAPGAQTLVKLRVTHEDWTDFDETNDYSYAAVTALTVNPKITVYRNGRLVWGVEPAQATWCTDPAHCVRALHMQGSTNMSYFVNPLLELVNMSPRYVPLSELTVRYWFTSDGSTAFDTACDYAWMGCDNVLRRYVTMSPARGGADMYMELGFRGDAVLFPGQSSGTVMLRANHANGSLLDQSNDYSFRMTSSYVENDKITVYRNGVRIWGGEPW